jgi:hypothetical protein
MPSRIRTLVQGLQRVALMLQRILSSIAASLARCMRRIVLSWHLTRARVERWGLRIHVPAGIWFCDGCREVLWDVDSFSSHTRMHARWARRGFDG